TPTSRPISRMTRILVIDAPRVRVESKVVRFARLAVLSGLSGTIACSLLLPYDDYDRAFGASDANVPEATTQPETAPPDVVPPTDASDAAPSCVMPAEPQCDADITSDPLNCGACGRRCLKANSACTGKLCDVDTAFALIFINPVGVGVDDKYFYGLGT